MKRAVVLNDSQVRVLLVSPLPPPSGGIGRWTMLLLDWLAAWPGISIRLVDPSVRWRDVWDMALWKRVVGGGLQGIWDAGRLLLQFAIFRPHVVHLCTSAQLRGPWDTVMLAVASLCGVRSLYHIRMGRLPELMAKRNWEWWGLWGALKLADRVVVLDVQSEAALKRFLPADRVLRLPNAIAVQPTPESNAHATDHPFVLYLGHVIPDKGMRELMQAWRQLRPPGWRLRIGGLGSADYKKDLLEIVGQDAGVECLGDLPRDQVWRCMQEAAIFVLPTYTEGFPNVILEAMAAGKPIISTGVGAIPEMLDAETAAPCGLVIPPRDVGALVSALRQLLTNPTMRHTLGMRALAKVSRAYDIDVVFEELIREWRHVSSRNRAGEGIAATAPGVSAPTPLPFRATPVADGTEKSATGRNDYGRIRLRPATHTPWWLDILGLVAERLSRQLYWSWPALRRWRKERGRRRIAPQECQREDLLDYLKRIGVTNGELVLLHTRTTGVRIHSSASGNQKNGCISAEVLLNDVLDLLGNQGTLAMPTNAKYQSDALEQSNSRDQVATYDPSRTLCSVGLLNDFFWRRRGVKRSSFPFNMLAACGPLADELIRNNLNENTPSPHGFDSGYYRICQRNGLVVSIGVPLRECLTIAHVVEEVRPDWPLADLFVERRYNVLANGTGKDWTVRLTRDDYDKYCHCRRKMGRDIVAEGVIHEATVGSLRVDWARAADIYEFFWRKTAKRPYPYYGLWLLRKPWRKQQATASSRAE